MFFWFVKKIYVLNCKIIKVNKFYKILLDICICIKYLDFCFEFGLMNNICVYRVNFRRNVI